MKTLIISLFLLFSSVVYAQTPTPLTAEQIQSFADMVITSAKQAEGADSRIYLQYVKLTLEHAEERELLHLSIRYGECLVLWSSLDNSNVAAYIPDIDSFGMPQARAAAISRDAFTRAGYLTDALYNAMLAKLISARQPVDSLLVYDCTALDIAAFQMLEVTSTPEEQPKHKEPVEIDVDDDAIIS